MNEILGAVRGRIVEIVNQSFHAHFFPVLVGGFRQAVRVHQDAGPRQERKLGIMVRSVIQQSQGDASGQRHFAGDPVRPQNDGMRMSGCGGCHDPGFQIQVNINGGGEHGGVRPLQDFGELVVEGSKESRRVIRQVGQLFHQAAEHGGDQGGADAVAHHVANDGANAGIAYGKSIEPVSCNPLRRSENMVKIRMAGQAVFRMGAGGNFVGKQGELDFPGQIYFLFQSSVAFLQDAGRFRGLDFCLHQFGDITGNTYNSL